MKPGLYYDLSELKYHSDPCEAPSLSASIASRLDRESELHAWAAHPRLGGRPPEASDDQEFGRLAHALMLEQGMESIEVVDADNWTKKAAREARDQIRARGNTPVLPKHVRKAQEMADAVRKQCEDLGIDLRPDGLTTEVTAVWYEFADDGTPVLCRGRLDWLHQLRIRDLKSSKKASARAVQRTIHDYGYHIQAAAYRSAVENLVPDAAGRVSYEWIFFEKHFPYAIHPCTLAGTLEALGYDAWRRAVNKWARCIRENEWPGYVKKGDPLPRIEAMPYALADAMAQGEEEAA